MGFGATMLMSAVVNFFAIEALFDASVENELGVSKAEMRWTYYAIGSVGTFLIVLGAVIPLPQPGGGNSASAPVRRPPLARKPPPRH